MRSTARSTLLLLGPGVLGRVSEMPPHLGEFPSLKRSSRQYSGPWRCIWITPQAQLS